MLRLATYNVEASCRHADETTSAIAATEADVVLLQETTPAWERVLRARFADTYHHMVFHHHEHGPAGLAVLSTGAILEDELLPGPIRNPAQRTVFATSIGPLQALNVHLRPAHDGGDWVKGWFTTPPLHRREIEVFCQHIHPHHPTVVAGDFNENVTNGQAIPFLIARGFTRVPTGSTWSYRGEHNGRDLHLEIDLDHVFVDERLVVHDATVLVAGASDHWPVVVMVAPATPA